MEFYTIFRKDNDEIIFEGMMPDESFINHGYFFRTREDAEKYRARFTNPDLFFVTSVLVIPHG